MAKCMNGKNFNKIMLSRIYFGNWLRDYSQAVGKLRIPLWMPRGLRNLATDRIR